jgi:hypothetical protein
MLRDPVGALAGFESPTPGSDPGGALAGFEAARKCRATVSRLIPSSRAIRRWDQPWVCKALIDKTLATFSSFAMYLAPFAWDKRKSLHDEPLGNELLCCPVGQQNFDFRLKLVELALAWTSGATEFGSSSFLGFESFGSSL